MLLTLIPSSETRKLLYVILIWLLFASGMQTVVAEEKKIWDRLQGSNPKGYVLLMRHALAPGIGDPENFQINDCSTQRNLSAEGRSQAAEIGQWLKETKIKILRVESSRWCRAKETARLLEVGHVRLNKNLDSLFKESDIAHHPQTLQIRRAIVAHRDKRGLLVMVGHYVNITALTGSGVESSAGVIVKADKSGRIKVLGETPVFKISS